MGSMQVRGILVALISLLFFPSLASACDWVFKPITELHENADAVFVGKVTESPWKRLPDGTTSSRPSESVRFTIERPIRGIQDKEVTFQALVSCGYPFLEGETYLVHASRNNGRLVTGYPMRPLHIAYATEALKYIDSVLSNRPSGMLLLYWSPGSNMVLRLDGSGRRLQVRLTPTQSEIAVPPGEYTVWLEHEGKVLSETKKVTITAKKTVSESLTVRF